MGLENNAVHTLEWVKSVTYARQYTESTWYIEITPSLINQLLFIWHEIFSVPLRENIGVTNICHDHNAGGLEISYFEDIWD